MNFWSRNGSKKNLEWQDVKAIERALRETGLGDDNSDNCPEDEGFQDAFDTKSRQRMTMKQLFNNMDGLSTKVTHAPNSSAAFFSNSLRYTRHCAEDYMMKSCTQNLGSDNGALSSPRGSEELCCIPLLKDGQSSTFYCENDCPYIRERSFSCHGELLRPRTEGNRAQGVLPTSHGASLREAAQRARERKFAHTTSDCGHSEDIRRGRSGSYGGELSCSKMELIQLHMKHKEFCKRGMDQEVGIANVPKESQKTFDNWISIRAWRHHERLPEIDIHTNVEQRECKCHQEQ